MNCQTARELLELQPPAERDAAVDGEAARHLDQCPACRCAVQRQVELDAQIGTVCRDVAIPDGLKERLLELLACRGEQPRAGATDVERVVSPVSAAAVEASSAVCAPQVGVAVRRPLATSKRRHWIGIGAVAALALVLCGIIGWRLWPRVEPTTLEEVAELITVDSLNPSHLDEIPKFSNGLVVPTPQTMDTHHLISAPKRLGTAGVNRDVAVYFFTLPGRRQTVLEGRLAVLPTPFVRTPPGATSFATVAPGYRGDFCTRSWTEGQFVYVCCLKGSGNDLNRLLPKQPPAT